MNRSIQTRLSKLEAMQSARPLRIVWSDTSDPEEWARKQADLIASGTAQAGDDFILIGWARRVPPASGGSRG
jgi:hypothetical protein